MIAYHQWTQIDHPYLMIASLLYVAFAIFWLWAQGMADGPAVGGLLLFNRAVLFGLFIAIGAFLVLSVTGVRTLPH